MKFRNLHKFIVVPSIVDDDYSTYYRLYINCIEMGLAVEIDQHYLDLEYHDSNNIVLQIYYQATGSISIQTKKYQQLIWKYEIEYPSREHTFKQYIRRPGIKIHNKITYTDDQPKKTINKLAQLFQHVSIRCAERLRKYNLNLKT